MRCQFVVAVISTVTASLTLWAWDGEPGRAQPPGTDVSGSGVHVTASVDSVEVNPSGDRTPNVLMTFSHAVQMSGSYSVGVEGDPITSGQAVAGVILGCGISVAGGVSVGIELSQRIRAGISSTVTSPRDSVVLPEAMPAPAPDTPHGTVRSPRVSLEPSLGGTLSGTEISAFNLRPGRVTVLTTATAALNRDTAFPFHIAFENAAVNVAQCASPVSAVPFTTTTVSTAQGLVQTTAYGDQFTF
ncbi:MspA family porin [Nocardia stercoris]|uniref:MspA family protein n=1 Tax=Nocardia stercoris TaxID=2483361 RepID=A0A3M2KTT6_9NOCA|nr:MspA family porin [Nocardia stercoris]RMI28531.1 hypothetical protein EBN03_29370 [Nocardia stercoris]